MIAARRQIELRHGRPHQALTLVLQPAKLPYLPDAHIGVANDIGCSMTGEALVLNIACGLDSCLNRFGHFACSIPAQFLVIHTRHFDVNINTVKQRSGDSLFVFRHSRRCAGT